MTSTNESLQESNETLIRSLQEPTIGDGLSAVARTARSNLGAFNAAVLRDERSGQRIQNAPVHRQWHQVVPYEPLLILVTSVESGKSQQVTVGYALWRLGRNPRMRIAVAGETAQKATKFTATIRNYIAHSSDLHAVFPWLHPGQPWKANQFKVSTASPLAKDYSIEAIGPGTDFLGSRYDLILVDDLFNFENTRTEYMRDKYLQWVGSTLYGRLQEGGQIIICTNAWHRYDAPHVLANDWGWRMLVCPMDRPLPTGEMPWGDHWSEERLTQWRATNPEYDRVIKCIPRRPGDRKFPDALIDKALQRGHGRHLQTRLEQWHPDDRIITAVDVGIGKKRRNHRSAVGTIKVHGGTQDREILRIDSGKWSGPDILRMAYWHWHRFGSWAAFVETNQAQEFLVQFAPFVLPDVQVETEEEGESVPDPERRRMRVRRYVTTGKSKWDPVWGLESLIVEMHNDKWIIPSGNDPAPRKGLEPEVRRLVEQMEDYSPEEHTGDLLMTVWLAREGARKAGFAYRVGNPVHDHPDNEEEARRREEQRRQEVDRALANPDELHRRIAWEGLGDMFRTV